MINNTPLKSFPPWRYPHVFSLWQQWLQSGPKQQLDRWLEKQFRQNKQFGKKDRAAYREVFFMAMRYFQLAQALEYSYRNTDTDWPQWDNNWQADAIECGTPEFWYWILLRANIESPIPRELNDGEARLQHFESMAKQWPSAALLEAENLLWHGFRPRWREALSQRQQHSQWTGSQLEHFIQQCNQPAPVCLRPQHCSADELARLLSAEGITTQASQGAKPKGLPPEKAHNGGLNIVGTINVNHSPAYQQGKFELQDAASQALAAAVTLSNNQTLWDVCAGAGGKSLAFANTAPNAQILASDTRSNALKQLAQRRNRGGFNNINIQQHDACQTLPPTLVPNNGFDWIFIDAPCSASGTWRRAADARWRMDDIDTLIELQQNIFSNATKHLRLEGLLVYATCSWLIEENEAQVAAFLENNPHFTLIEQQCVGSPNINADTMFFAKLQRSQ